MRIFIFCYWKWKMVEVAQPLWRTVSAKVEGVHVKEEKT